MPIKRQLFMKTALSLHALIFTVRIHTIVHFQYILKKVEKKYR